MRLVALSLGVCLGGCAGRPPAVQVTGSREIGIVGQSALIVGRDGGWGVRLWDHEVFLFGDTFVSKADVDGSSFHSNSFSFTDDTNAADGITGLADRLDPAGSPQPLITPTADDAAFIAAHRGDNCAQKPCGARWATWPGATVFDPGGHRALISYGLIYAEPGAFNFHGVGQSLAVWSDFSQQAVRPVAGRCQDHPTLLFCQDEPAWGSAMVVQGDQLFAFACPGNQCMLARVPLSQALDRSAWQAWDGSAWQPSLTAAQSLFAGAPILRVFFNQHAGAWMAVYSEPLSDDVSYRTAPALTGPWSDAGRLFVADHKQNDGGWTYDSLVQPDYQQDSGQTIYVTYSRPTGTPFGSELALQRVSFE